MPRAIPEEHHTNLIYVSGVVELVCAAGLLRRTRWAAAASVATLAAVFPANVQMALDAGTGATPARPTAAPSPGAGSPCSWSWSGPRSRRVPTRADADGDPGAPPR